MQRYSNSAVGTIVNQLWLDATNNAMYSGTGTWFDMTGNNNNATNRVPGTTTMPTLAYWPNGNRVARFSPQNKTSMITTLAPTNATFSYAIVARINDPVVPPATIGFLLHRNGNSNDVISISNTSFPVNVVLRTNATTFRTVVTVQQYEPFLITFDRPTSGGISIYANGSLVASAVSGTTSFGSYIFGSSNVDSGYISADLAEVMIMSSNIFTERRQNVEGYLAWKWGLVDKLPVDHPFKTIKY
jgi:hypothetical protein